MIDTPAIVESAAQHTAVIKLVIPTSKVREVMGPTHDELVATLKQHGVTPSGPWFTRHFAMPSDVFDYEVGVPVANPVAAMGRVTPGTLPAAKVARTVLRGGYEQLGQAWGELFQWVAKNGHQHQLPFWEQYLTDGTTELTVMVR